ncbi:MAG: Protein translocase subunit SecD [Dehalococcoidia bacterium]|nr:Protein translocase subunit SecD [Dehalococcoidia bacterium]
MIFRKERISFFFILVILGLCVASLAFRVVNIGGFQRGQADTLLGMKLGLDLQGGTHLVYRAKDPNVTADQIHVVADVIERRINAFGVAEPLIQVKGHNEIVIQIPGVRDLDEAKRLIGGTAQLDFRACSDPNVTFEGLCPSWERATAEGSGGVQKNLTGAFLLPTSAVMPDPNSGLPTVTFEFNDEGARMFEQITKRLLGKPLGIFLDDQLVSAPTVQAVISQSGVISNLAAGEAKLLAIQLNAGALPVPITIVREENVSPTLGKDSLNKSYIAGAIGIGLVLLFMVLYYRLFGVVSVFSLGFYYIVLSLAIFKMIPITLTVTGLAGFVVSVGLAVDAHVLIFERTREEVRAGRTLASAIEIGHTRAWAAIRDGHVAAIITMVLLWWFGEQLGETKVIGFSITMVIALVVSLFTAMFVAKTVLRMIGTTRLVNYPRLFVPLAASQRRARGSGLGATSD